MEIRKYRESDSEEKRKLHMKVIKEVNKDDYSKHQIQAWTTFDEGSSVSKEVIERWVAVKNGGIVGFSDYRYDEGSITGVYVHPDHLREGIGSKLLEKIVEDARNRGLEKLKCQSSVTAREFYQKHGFEVVEETTYETNDEELEASGWRKKLLAEKYF
jgi:putative acetyltransferase